MYNSERKMWYNWDAVPRYIRWRLRDTDDSIKIRRMNHVLLLTLMKATLSGCVTYPEFLPKWRIPKTKDVPYYLSSDEALNKYREIWRYEVPVSDARIFVGNYTYTKIAAEAICWCARNCTDNWHAHPGAGLSFWFVSGKDASLFKLFFRPPDEQFLFAPSETTPNHAPLV